VGCCDESKNRHATAHYHATGHPIIRSQEPGESWMWCYKDEVILYPPDAEGQEVRFAVTKEFLRRLPIFGELADEHLNKLCDIAEPRSIPAGGTLIAEGSEADAMYVIVDGEFEVTKRAGNSDVVIGTRGPGDVLGEMALLEQARRNASVRALRDGRVLVISRDAFYNLLAGSPSAVMAILRTFIARLRSTETLLVQHDKLASLGTLAAGLAHELNNPATAAGRSADQLREVLGQWQQHAMDLDHMNFDDTQAEALGRLRENMQERAASKPSLDTLEQADRESDMQDRLEELGVEEAWDIAPVLVSFGWEASELESALEPFTPKQVPAIVPWLAAGASAYGLLNEVRNSTERISEIVKSVKDFTFMDQAPVQEVNVHDGLDGTLTMLNHLLKQGVTVTKEYAPNLPKIAAYGSALNQVWTNLIDNAVSAMGGQGEITIKTYAQGTNVVVEIADSGPGIPPENQSRIFEPFFTTKGPGVGTGLGLHIVYNIVVDRHHGNIKVTSRPGYTCFQVTLPIHLSREAPG
jgi:signal transduction histidine kinase